jgi:hypothetical protein
VLTWTRGPQDLDIGLDGPVFDGTRFAVHSGNFGTCDRSPWACKDRDITSLPGAETITLVRQIPGTYALRVFNYTNESAIDPAGTKVEVYAGRRLLRTITPPAATPREWLVFELANGELRIPQAPIPTEAVARVTVTPSPISLVVGAQQRFTAEVRDAGGNVLAGRVVTWRSSAPAVMPIDSVGVARAIAAGPVEITATAEGVSGSATVRVFAGGTRFLSIVTENPTSTSVGARAVMRARVTDGINPVAGATITWLQEGFLALTTPTNADGEAAVILPTDRAGSFTGRAQLMAGTTVERTVPYSYTVNP